MTVAVNGAPAGQQFILGIKYDTGAVVGTSVSSPFPTVHYSWSTLVNGVLKETDPDGLDLKAK